MNDQPTATLTGNPVDSPVDSPVAKPPSRAQRVEAWRKENAPAYRQACEAQCTCTPSRAQMLLVQQWESPPID